MPRSASYRDYVLSTRPIRYWPLDELGGLARDRSPAADHGTQVSTSPGKPGPLPNDRASAMGFDGTSSKVTAGSFVAPTPQLSIMQWVRTTASGAQRALFSNRGSGQGLYFGTSNADQAFIYGGASLVSTRTIVDGRWHLVIASNDTAANVGKIYVDGVLDATSTLFFGTGNPANPISIGIDAGGGGNWLGQGAHVALWNRILGAAEILELYAASSRPAWRRPAGSYSIVSGGGTGAYGAGAYGAGPYGGSGDTTSPTVPTGLSATAINSTRIDLAWVASTDNVAVTGYDVYRGGSLLVTLGAITSYSDTSCSPSTTYSYTVDAFDAAGNYSAQSSSASATTPAAAVSSAGATTPAGGGPTIPSRLGYRYLFYDLVSNAPKGELELSGVRYSRLLNAAGSFSGTLALGDSRVLNKNPIGITEPRKTRLYIEREGSLVWGGIVWTRRYDDHSRALQLGGQEFWSYFQTRGADTGRFIVDSLTWTQKDQLGIANDLLAYAQGQSLTSVDGAPKTFPKPGGNLGIVASSATSGVLRDRTYDATSYQEIGRALEELQAVDNGFDFSIDVAYVAGVATANLVLSYPRRGVTVPGGGPIFEKPGNILGYAWPEDGTQFADTAYALGDGEGAAMLRSSASRTDLIDQGYPLIEMRRSYKGSGINQQSTLDAHARADVNAAASASAFPTLRVRGSGPVPVGAYTTGDDCRLRISDERFPNPGYGGVDTHLDTYYRIIGYEVTAPSGTQDEEVAITLGAVA